MIVHDELAEWFLISIWSEIKSMCLTLGVAAFVLELIELCCGLLAKGGVVRSHRQCIVCFHCSGGDSVVHAHCQFYSSLLLKITSAPKCLFGRLMVSDMEKNKCHRIRGN